MANIDEKNNADKHLGFNKYTSGFLKNTFSANRKEFPDKNKMGV